MHFLIRLVLNLFHLGMIMAAYLKVVVIGRERIGWKYTKAYIACLPGTLRKQPVCFWTQYRPSQLMRYSLMIPSFSILSLQALYRWTESHLNKRYSNKYEESLFFVFCVFSTGLYFDELYGRLWMHLKSLRWLARYHIYLNFLTPSMAVTSSHFSLHFVSRQNFLKHVHPMQQ